MSTPSHASTKPIVAYLGPPASFSHQAALELFANNADVQPYESFAAVLNALHPPKSSKSCGGTGKVSFAIVPIENSSNGTVVSLLDLLADRSLRYPNIKVCAEYYLSVHHCLLARPGKGESLANGGVKSSEDTTGKVYSIEKIYSHPQVWGQCTRFLSERLQGTAKIDTASTSAAAKLVAQSSTVGQAGRVAAVASSLAAHTHGLEILASNIEDEGDNTTRFLVLYNESAGHADDIVATSSQGAARAGQRKWKSLISFTLDHSAPGSLADALAVFRKHGFNLTSIETRPSRQRPWHYIFFVECEEVRDQRQGPSFTKMFEDLQKCTEKCRDFGSWGDEWREIL